MTKMELPRVHVKIVIDNALPLKLLLLISGGVKGSEERIHYVISVVYNVSNVRSKNVLHKNGENIITQMVPTFC